MGINIKLLSHQIRQDRPRGERGVFGWLSLVEGSSLTLEFSHLGDYGGAHCATPVIPILTLLDYFVQL